MLIELNYIYEDESSHRGYTARSFIFSFKPESKPILHNFATKPNYEKGQPHVYVPMLREGAKYYVRVIDYRGYREGHVFDVEWNVNGVNTRHEGLEPTSRWRYDRNKDNTQQFNLIPITVEDFKKATNENGEISISIAKRYVKEG
jgi:hypothetical protein